ncbi:MAG: arginine--tRNA ligase, partial [Holosporales bacterium]|nr:arginine--tRNA ligase [Holosporales bacterium]
MNTSHAFTTLTDGVVAFCIGKMYLIKLIQTKIEEAAASLHPSALANTKSVQVELSKDASHGEIATNAAMVLCKQLGSPPRDLANQLAEKIRTFDEVASVEVAGAGFVNITLHSSVWVNELRNIVRLGKEYSAVNVGNGETVHVEFVSANPTGPMHAGHVRNAVLGDTIASLLSKVGFNVYREYYVNDAGSQVDCLARSVYLRYTEALGEPLPPDAFAGNLYPGEYLIPLGKMLAESSKDMWTKEDESVWLPKLRDFSVRAMMDIIREDLNELG